MARSANILERWVSFIFSHAVKRPLLSILTLFLLSAPAFYGVSYIQLDTNLIRLLPDHSPASTWTRKLKDKIGDGGYFTLLLEGSPKERLIEAVKDAAERIETLPEVHSVSWHYPADYINQHKYLLIEESHLEDLLDNVIRLEAKHNPFSDDLLSPQISAPGQETKTKNRTEKALKDFDHITKFHQSPDGKLMGIFIRPRPLITDLDSTRKLFGNLKKVASAVSLEHQVYCQVGGSQIKNLREYDSVLSDLGKAGLISGTLLFLILVVAFKSLRIIPIMVIPLALGLLWFFALIPIFIGPLNIITAFLLLILAGLGIDYAIHLLMRLQQELTLYPLDIALVKTFTSTGKAVLISGLTTALPMLVLSFSDFRGFSDFGMIMGGAILSILLAMMVVMPVTMVLGYNFSIVRGRRHLGRYMKPVSLRTTVIMVMLVAAVCVYGGFKGATYNYNFSAYGENKATIKSFKKKHKSVYPHSMSPAALYLIPTLSDLDRLRASILKSADNPNSRIDHVSSIHDFAPAPDQYRRRLHLVKEIKEILKGTWVHRIEDPVLSRRVRDVRKWQIPSHPPRIEDVPAEIRAFYSVLDGSGRFVAGIYSKGSRRNGRNAMAFTRELNTLKLPVSSQGPVGEIPVFAEILSLIFREGPWVISLALFAVAIPILISTRSLKDTFWMLFPLITGMGATLSVMAWTGTRLNHFNFIIFPALLGMGVDDGVHYFQRAKECGGDIFTTQKELWNPLTICTLTTMMGYFGLILSGHSGLRSIGILAVLGMACLWLTSLIVFPNVLRWWFQRQNSRNTLIAVTVTTKRH